MRGWEVDSDALLRSIFRRWNIHMEVVSQIETRVCGQVELSDEGIGCV